MKRITKIFTVIIIFSASCCGMDRSQKTTPLFASIAMQNVLEKYLDCIESFHDDFPNISYVMIYEENGRSKIDIISTPGDCIWPMIDSTVVLLCAGKVNGKLVFVSSNPKFNSWVNWKGFSLQKEDKKLLTRDIPFEGNLNQTFLSLDVITPDSLVINNCSENLTIDCERDKDYDRNRQW